MKRFRITEDDYAELWVLADYLIAYHKDIINSHPVYKLPKGTPVSEKLNFGAVIGYKGKTIYEIINNKAISSRSLALFNERFKRLKDGHMANPIARSYITRASNLSRKLESQVIDDGEVVHKKDSLVMLFENTRWYLYERSKDAIERHLIKFEKSAIEGQLTVEIESNRENTSSWVGKAIFTSNNELLVIETFYKDQVKSLPINLLIRVSNRYTSIDLCIGHMTHTRDSYHSIVTKIIVIENQTENANPTKARFRLNEAGIGNAVAKGIYKLLWNRKLSRLSAPHPAIINQAMLDQWYAENEQAKRQSRNENIIGEYSIYYKGEPEPDYPLTKDKLVIKENIHADLIAEYIHEVDKGKPQIWRGDVTYSSVTRAAFISLVGPFKGDVSENISTIFLTLNIPAGGRMFDTVTGIVCGVNDRDEGALAMLVVAVKNSREMDYVDHQDKVANFFKKTPHPSYIFSPEIPVANIEDLSRNLTKYGG